MTADTTPSPVHRRRREFAQRVRGKDCRYRIAVALDVPTDEAALRLVEGLGDDLRVVKVGLQLFTASGGELVRALRQRGLEVFLDLKLHDIPNTMAGAMRSMADLDVALATVHAAAGRRAIETTCETSRDGGGPAVLAVTVLTSFDAPGLSEVFGRDVSASEEVLRLARLATASGADGLVASPQEVSTLREAVGSGPLLVIPGIRPSGTQRGDQSRVATPAEALAAGADLLVVGRPIRDDVDPRAALARILDEMEGAR